MLTHSSKGDACRDVGLLMPAVTSTKGSIVTHSLHLHLLDRDSSWAWGWGGGRRRHLLGLVHIW